MLEYWIMAWKQHKPDLCIESLGKCWDWSHIWVYSVLKATEVRFSINKSNKDCQKIALQMVLLGPLVFMPGVPATGGHSMTGFSATSWSQRGGHRELWPMVTGENGWPQCQLLEWVKDSAASYWDRHVVHPENQLLGALVWVKLVSRSVLGLEQICKLQRLCPNAPPPAAGAAQVSVPDPKWCVMGFVCFIL